MPRSSEKQKKSLSLLEIFFVFFMIAVLASVVLSAVNPRDRQADARDAQRIVDMHALITAIHQYVVDTNGSLPEGVTAQMHETQLGNCVTGGNTLCTQAQDSCVDISKSIAPYLSQVPTDPLLVNREGLSGYSIRTSEDGLVTVRACGAETSELEVSR